MSPVRFNLGESQLMRSWFEAGVSVTEIASRLGRKRTSVWTHLTDSRTGRGRVRRHFRPQDDEEENARRDQRDETRHMIYETAIGKTQEQTVAELAGRWAASTIRDILCSHCKPWRGMPALLVKNRTGVYERKLETQHNVYRGGRSLKGNRRVRVKEVA